MTSAELRGFNMALQCMITWARQTEATAVSVGGSDDAVPRSQLLRHSARLTRGMAEAMALTLGKPETPEHRQLNLLPG